MPVFPSTSILSLSGQSLTGSQATSLVDLAGTWNTTGTPTALKLNVTDTASNAASLLMDLQVGGASKFNVRKDGRVNLTGDLVTAGTIYSTTNGTIALGISNDVVLTRDGAADTLALRRSTNAQAFRVYGTYTDASNYERGLVGWVGSQFSIRTQATGSATPRQLTLGTDSSSAAIQFVTNNTDRWNIAGAGHLLANTDNTYDIGASGATRPRTIYAGTSTITPLLTFSSATTTLSASATNGGLNIGQNSSPFANCLLATVGTNMLGIGGITSSFPALKRNSTALETKLADDSAYAPHAAQYFEVTDGITAPGSSAGRARIYVDTADGDLKIVFGDGTIKTIVVDT